MYQVHKWYKQFSLGGTDKYQKQKQGVISLTSSFRGKWSPANLSKNYWLVLCSEKCYLERILDCMR